MKIIAEQSLDVRTATIIETEEGVIRRKAQYISVERVKKDENLADGRGSTGNDDDPILHVLVIEEAVKPFAGVEEAQSWP